MSDHRPVLPLLIWPVACRYDSIFGGAETKTVELKKGGASIPLTHDNREGASFAFHRLLFVLPIDHPVRCAEYVRLMVEWELERSIEKQYKAFENGFLMVCGGHGIKVKG